MNDSFINRIRKSSSIDELAECFNFVVGLKEKIIKNLLIISESSISFKNIKEELLKRLLLINNLNIQIIPFFEFFESQYYWNLEYKNIEDHIYHTKTSFPNPLYYSARQFIDYAIFPTYFFRVNEILEFLTSYFGKSYELNFLDVGVGSGEISKRILEEFSNSNCTGIDVIPDNISFIKYYFFINKINKNRYKLVEMNIEKPISNSNSLRNNLIVCSEVLEHLYYPGVALKNIINMLNKNGIAIITIPLEDPGHEHIQNFKNENNFLDLIPQDIQILKIELKNWSGYKINDSSYSTNKNRTIKHLFVIIKK